MTTTHLDSETRRQQIIDAARRLIVARGMAGLTVQDLAEAVSLSEGALYRHFKTKDDILLLLVDDVEETLLQVVDEVMAGPGSALERLEELLQRHLSYAERRRGVSFIVIAEAMQLGGPRLRRAVSDLVEAYLERVARLVGEAVESGEADPIDPEAGALLFFGMVQANVTLWSLKRRRHPIEEFGTAMWLAYRDGLRGRREEPLSDGGTRG